MTKEQRVALEALLSALVSATDTGVLDMLLDFAANPGSINDVCDSVINLMETQLITCQ